MLHRLNLSHKFFILVVIALFMVAQVTQGSGPVATASAEIAEGNNDLSARARPMSWCTR